MRRAAIRTGLVAWATLASALVVRKFLPASAADGARPASDDAPAVPPPLQPVATALRRVQPPTPLPALAVEEAVAGGGVATRPLASLLGAHGAVLNVWASWCGPCRAEMASLAALRSHVWPDGIAVLPLSIDRGGVAASARFLAAAGGEGLPALADPGGAAQAALGLGAIPVTLLVDGRGQVVARLDGAADWAAASAVSAVRLRLA